MTTALCFNCGETKFGAFCPCAKCGVGSSGDHNLDILFSDHRMSVATLRDFGAVIKQLAARCDDPDVRFWAFVSYVSTHPAQLLSATTPPELADRVERLLAEARLPLVAAQVKPQPKETPQKAIAVPGSLLRAYLNENAFDGLQPVQLRRHDGSVVSGVLFDDDGKTQFIFRDDIELIPEDVAAIRTAPGCLIGWLVRPRWIETP